MFNKSPWQSSPFTEEDSDPLAGFANIMDVMLVFALGLMLALVAQSRELRQHFQLDPQLDAAGTEVQAGRELIEAPESIQQQISGGSGMQSLGQVYKDPKTGKLILIGKE